MPLVAKVEKHLSRRLGEMVRGLREAQGVTQKELGGAVGIRNAQVSKIEKGANVWIEHYEVLARYWKFRDALEMFAGGSDRTLRELLRLWPALGRAAQKDVLRRVKQMLAAEPESDATSREG